MNIRVVLLNRCLPYNVVGTLTGLSGVKYADSVFDHGIGAHVARMGLEEYRAAKRDIATGAFRKFQQWEVDFEEIESAPDTSKANARPQRRASSRSARRAGQKAAPVPPATPSGPHTAETLATLKFFSLLKIGREVGVPEPDKFDNTAALRAAILAKQGAPA